MGYDCSFTLECSSPILIESFRDFSEMAAECLTPTGRTRGPWTWYEAETELTNFSLLWPSELFTLGRWGAEAGDWECTYVKNGRSYSVKATLPPFDASKLE